MKTFAKLLVLAMFVATMIPTFSFADDSAVDPQLRADIEKMLTMTKMDKMMEPMYSQLEAMLQNQYQQMGATEEQLPIFEKYNKQMFDLLKTEMSWENLRDQFIDLYARVYSSDEIKAISDFYSSAAGQKMIEKMPMLMQESMVIAQDNMKDLIPQIQIISRQMIEELQEAAQPEEEPAAQQ